MDCSGTKNVGAYALPDDLWQSRQWQLPEITGSTEHLYFTAPHKHWPVMLIADSPCVDGVNIRLTFITTDVQKTERSDAFARPS